MNFVSTFMRSAPTLRWVTLMGCVLVPYSIFIPRGGKNDRMCVLGFRSDNLNCLCHSTLEHIRYLGGDSLGLSPPYTVASYDRGRLPSIARTPPPRDAWHRHVQRRKAMRSAVIHPYVRLKAGPIFGLGVQRPLRSGSASERFPS